MFVCKGEREKESTKNEKKTSVEIHKSLTEGNDFFLLLVCIVCQRREAETTNPVCLFKSGPGKSKFSHRLNFNRPVKKVLINKIAMGFKECIVLG